jgi:hypothetical protein
MSAAKAFNRQARVAEALMVGAETYDDELEMGFLSRLSPAG